MAYSNLRLGALYCSPICALKCFSPSASYLFQCVPRAQRSFIVAPSQTTPKSNILSMDSLLEYSGSEEGIKSTSFLDEDEDPFSSELLAPEEGDVAISEEENIRKRRLDRAPRGAGREKGVYDMIAYPTPPLSRLGRVSSNAARKSLVLTPTNKGPLPTQILQPIDLELADSEQSDEEGAEGEAEEAASLSHTKNCPLDEIFLAPQYSSVLAALKTSNNRYASGGNAKLDTTSTEAEINQDGTLRVVAPTASDLWAKVETKLCHQTEDTILSHDDLVADKFRQLQQFAGLCSNSDGNRASEEEPYSATNVAKFDLLTNAELTALIPEGVSGGLKKDLLLIPKSQPILGLMYRKVTHEILTQLKLIQNDSTFAHRGFLLDGKRGAGKSAVLLHIVRFCRLNNWLVLWEPSPGCYAREVSEIKRSSAGIYVQSEFAVQFLEHFAVFNRELLQQIPIDLHVYGCAALDGTHRRYARGAYDVLIEETISKETSGTSAENGNRDVSKPITSDIEVIRENLRLWSKYRSEIKIPSIKEKLRDPQSLWDLVEFGLNNEALATQCLYETMEQLKKQTTFPLLIAVDEWNDCFGVSEYLSMKYENTKYNGWIPSFHLSLPRLFHKFDGHEFKRGLKIYATSWTKSNRRSYQPKLLGVRPEEVRTVRNFTPVEFRNYVAYFERQSIIDNFPQDRVPYFYMLTGGNGFEARRLLATLY